MCSSDLGLDPLKRRLASIGRIAFEQAGDKTAARIDGSAPDSLAARLKKAHDDLQQALEAYNQDARVVAANARYQLKRVPAPRYWQPNEPVVLLSGPPIKRMVRHGEDGRLNPNGRLDCQLLANVSARFPVLGDDLAKRMDQLTPAPGTPRIGFETWTEQP